jgi:dihydroorotase
MLTINPAKLYGLEEGSIKVGSKADLVIFDINKEFIYEKSSSKSQNSPFLGEKLKGKVMYTIKNGEVVYSEDDRFNC